MSEPQRASTPTSETGSEQFELIGGTEDESKKLEATVDEMLSSNMPLTESNKAALKEAADATHAAAEAINKIAAAESAIKASEPTTPTPTSSTTPAAAAATATKTSTPAAASSPSPVESKKSNKGATAVMVAPPETKGPFLSCINKLKNILPPQVARIIYYENPKSSGIWIGALVLGWLLSCSCCCGKLLPWATYGAFLVLTGLIIVSFAITLFFRFAKKQTDIPNPITNILLPKLGCCNSMCASACPALPSKDTVVKYVASGLDLLPQLMAYARRIFSVESFSESIKAAFGLYVLSLLSCWLSIKTMLIITLVGLFTIPFAYAKYQTQIDAKVEPVVEKVKDVVSKVTAKLPFLNSKAKQE